jgi:hypothetical protein
MVKTAEKRGVAMASLKRHLMLGGKYGLVSLLVAAMLYASCVNLIPHEFHTPGK